MIDCTALADRMPDVAHGADAWTSAELGHLGACGDCAAEWRLVQRGFALHRDLVIDSDRTTALLLSRLRDEPAGRVIGRLPWRAGALGIVAAAAASILLVFYVPQHRPVRTVLLADTATLGVLPELQGLSETELQAMLGAIAPATSDVSSGIVPHLDDLTDAELEQLLRTEEGGE